MTLLALLAQLDPGACQRVMDKIWPSRSTTQDPSEDARDAALILVLDWTIHVIDHLANLREFVDSAQNQSLAFEDAVRSIQAWPSLDGVIAANTSTPCIHVLINGDVECDDPHDMTVALEAIYMLATRCHGSSASVYGVRFQIDFIYNLLGYCAPLEEAELELVGNILDLGIRFDAVPHFNNGLAERHDAARLVKTVRSLLLPVMASSCDLDVVSVAQNSSLKVVESVLTAAQHNKTASRFRLKSEDDLVEVRPWNHKEQMWKLIARCLFSAQHSIRSLELALDGFDSVCLNGVRAGYEDVVLDSRPEEDHQITASRFHLENPDQFYIEGWEQAMPVVYENATSITTPVLEHFFTPDDIEWRSCMLPGWGCARVPAEDVVAAAVDDKHDQDRTYPTFDEITVDGMNDESRESTAELLNLIGRKTRKLTVTNEGLGAMNWWARTVLENCRTLQDLQFDRGNFSSLEALVDCGVTGHSRLQRLSLSSVSFENPDPVLVFFSSPVRPKSRTHDRSSRASCEIRRRGHVGAGTHPTHFSARRDAQTKPNAA